MNRFRPFFFVAGLLALALILLAVPTPVAAGAVSWSDGTVTITLNFPDSYGSCAPSDTIYTTGLPATWKVMGQYAFYNMSVSPPVRLTAYTNQTSIGADLQQQIVYPPVSSWPLVDAATGARTIWVHIMAVIFDEAGQMVAQLAPPAGYKWTVICTPPPVVIACSPGFWKNHPELWVGYDPADDFDTTFGVDYFNPDITLMQGVSATGGGLNKVARFGVANLLNATHPGLDFALTLEQVVAMVQAGDGDGLSGYVPAGHLGPLE
jgi:hypothetical protein